MFVISSDFDVPPFSLPNLGSNSSFADFVEEQEEEVLKKLLGIAFYDLLIAGITANTTKWLLIKNGSGYVYNEVSYEWLGLKKMLIPYIWYMWVKETLSDSLTGVGIVAPESENGSVINPGVKLAAAYNKFSKLAGGRYCIENSLYGFLYKNATDYVGYSYTPQGTINTFNL